MKQKKNNDLLLLQGEEFAGETDIPIFTDQFLHHNKQRESELRQLRKANSDYEQQVNNNIL